ncbi:NifS Cysteine sulfinate desulfinase/cysteine desulfurase and related enzymes [Candidatus Nanopelagicaceae bacterium]
MRSVVAGRGIVLGVARLTENFTSEAPLSGPVLEAISTALSQGWADPKKLSQASHMARGLKAAAVEEIASHLAISPGNLEVLGEPSLAHFVAIGGYLSNGKRLITSGVDVGKIRAIARAHPGRNHALEVSIDGQILSSEESFSKDDVASIQCTNGETGIGQNLDSWRNSPASIILDATRTIPGAGLADGFAAATFDAASWNGPTGVSIIAINDAEKFRYPLPHIAPIRVPGSFSLPLLVGSAIALTEMKKCEDQIYSLREYFATQLSGLDGLELIGGESDHQSRYLTALCQEFSGEEVLRELLKRDIAIDSGSACSPEDLAPSHVLASMGYPTAGSLRFTLHPAHTKSDIDELIEELKKVLVQLRS